VEVRVLGALELVAGDGTIVDVPGRRQRRFIALLASRSGQVVSVDALVEGLWDDDERPARADAALHSLVARVRRTLDAAGMPGVVRTEPSGYRLDTDLVTVDAERFEALARVNADAPAELTVERLAAAESLWRGTAYDEFGDSDELRAEGVRLDELRIQVAERRGAALVATGRADDAIGHLHRLVSAEPFREGPVAALMRAYDVAGRQRDALATYQQYRERLAREVGLEPSAALQRLEASVLRDPEGPSTWQPTSAFESMRVTYVPSGRHPDVRLAVGEAGVGRTLVSVPAWVTSLDVLVTHGDPRSAVLERLARTMRVVMYDQPGTGLSPGDVTDFSLAGSVADLLAVVEHARRGAPVSLMATSAAGPTALAFAADHPELVDRLVLFGTFADPVSTFPDREFTRALVALVTARWGRGSGMLAGLYRPGISDDGARRLSRILRDSAGPVAGAGYLAAVYDADVTELLPRVRHPALVIHYRDDKVIPFSGGRHLAQALPNARFMPLDGGYHLPDIADTPLLERAIRSFLAGDAADVRPG
jgi:DNA-binding SARP family transcriptional activator/pimeloyl-ACP methyl ester carboxylesterase